MNYYFLNPQKEQRLFISDKKDQDSVIDNIIKLRESLSDKIPEKKLSGNLILGTWNLREFGNSKYGGRMTESLYYIAEIISRFDLIAIQEVRDNLKDINSICRILGSNWGTFTSVVTQGASGNKERLTFLYDKRTVTFKDVAGQIILPSNSKLGQQFARSPYIIRFQSGWLKFDICTVHIYFGNASKKSSEYGRRVEEIKELVDFFEKYYVAKNEANNIFLLGDFNIEDTASDTYKAATSNIFSIPDAILKSNLKGSNVKQDKIYDQILYQSKYNNISFKNAGIYDFFNIIFDDFTTYQSRIEKHTAKGNSKNFETFRTYQMSDHLPLWVEMNTDQAQSYLEYLKK